MCHQEPSLVATSADSVPSSGSEADSPEVCRLQEPYDI